jgi:hypothetical protein
VSVETDLEVVMDKIEEAKEICRELTRGDREKKMLGYGPTPATVGAMDGVGLSDDDPDRAKIFAHTLGFHDAILRDGGGYKVPEGVGADYEEGHRIGAEEDREKLYPAPREVQ